MKDESYKDLIAFLYDNRELLSSEFRKIVEDKMVDILIDDLIDRIAKIIVKENKNDAE